MQSHIMPANPIERRITQLARQLDRIYRALDKQARADRCKGDICTGWDWPTLCAVKPDVAQRIAAIKREGREAIAALRSAGLHADSWSKIATAQH